MDNDQYWDCDHCQERYPYGTGRWDPIEVESWTVALVKAAVPGEPRRAIEVEPGGEVEWLCGECASRAEMRTEA